MPRKILLAVESRGSRKDIVHAWAAPRGHTKKAD